MAYLGCPGAFFSSLYLYEYMDVSASPIVATLPSHRSPQGTLAKDCLACGAAGPSIAYKHYKQGLKCLRAQARIVMRVEKCCLNQQSH